MTMTIIISCFVDTTVMLPCSPHLTDIPMNYNNPFQVLLRYLLQRGVVVLPKSVTDSRIKQNFDVSMEEGMRAHKKRLLPSII